MESWFPTTVSRLSYPTWEKSFNVEEMTIQNLRLSLGKSSEKHEYNSKTYGYLKQVRNIKLVC